MSLDNIQLSPNLVKQLYGNTLISLDNNQIVLPKKKAKTLESLGDNLQQILILVDHVNQKFLADDELEFLSKILKACNLSLADVAILNLHTQPELRYEGLNEKFNPKLVLCFGLEPERVGYPIQFPANKLQAWNNQTFLHTPELSILKTNLNEKRNFWNCLRIHFNK